MHILLAFVGIVAGAAFWWYRLKMMNDAAGEVVDAVGRVRGNMRRKKIRTQNELSPVTAIDDPVVAAATLIAALMSEETALNAGQEKALHAEIEAIGAPGKTEEALIYAKWAAGQIGDAGIVIDKVAPLLRDRLDEVEKLGLLEMIGRVARASAGPVARLDNNLRKLRQKLGLVVN